MRFVVGRSAFAQSSLRAASPTRVMLTGARAALAGHTTIQLAMPLKAKPTIDLRGVQAAPAASSSRATGNTSNRTARSSRNSAQQLPKIEEAPDEEDTGARRQQQQQRRGPKAQSAASSGAAPLLQPATAVVSWVQAAAEGCIGAASVLNPMRLLGNPMCALEDHGPTSLTTAERAQLRRASASGSMPSIAPAQEALADQTPTSRYRLSLIQTPVGTERSEVVSMTARGAPLVCNGSVTVL